MAEMLRWIKISLRILAKVKPNGRINTRGKTIVIEKDSLFQGMWRFWNSDSRIESVESVRSIVTLATELSQLIVGQKVFLDFGEAKVTERNLFDFKVQCNQLLEIGHDMQASIEGIKNLMIGYKNDERVVAEFEMMILKILQEVDSIEKHISLVMTKYNSDHPETPLSIPLLKQQTSVTFD